jgi:competence protein ComEC
MHHRPAHPFTKTPALRLLLPFMTGVLVQWYQPFSLSVLITGGLLLLFIALLYQALPLTRKYQFAAANGILIGLLMAFIGAGVLHNSDIRNHKDWFGHHLSGRQALLLTLEEPLVEKPASWKAIASVKEVYHNGEAQPAEGKLIIYFKKDSLPQGLGYGTRLVVAKPVQSIKHSGNPGAFDYSRYSLFQGITHQVYLVPTDYRVLPQKEVRVLKPFLFNSRRAVLDVLQTYISGDKERGLAQALLIGYKDDLDKSLLRSYSNTGVVHVIAISGLHVGLIYWLLLGLTRPLKRKGLLWMRLLVLLAGLWGFGLLAGAGASVMRSVVMFSFLAAADVLDRRASVYNTLALSALLLLCYQPFWLWDIGFQLSYAAVFSILVFYRPISGLIYFPNKAMAALWKMNAVTLSAQVFTTPLVLYHFHQFPNLFVLTNLLAVPLSSLILLGELLLCALAFLPSVANLLGQLLTGMIRYMNTYVEQMDGVSFAVWSGISLSAVQTIMLTACTAAVSVYLLHEKKRALPLAFGCAACFLLLRSYSFVQANRQQKLIVYQVPKHRAIDIMEGRHYYFLGDATVQQDLQLRNYHLQPSRILHRVEEVAVPKDLHSFRWQGKQVLIIDTTLRLKRDIIARPIDLLILSGSPKLYMHTLVRTFQPKQVVADASVPRWKATLWKRDCDSLRIPFHDVSDKGAFVMTL